MLGAGEIMHLWDLGPGLFLNKAYIVVLVTLGCETIMCAKALCGEGRHRKVRHRAGEQWWRLKVVPRAHGAGPGRNLVGKEPLGRLGLQLS